MHKDLKVLARKTIFEFISKFTYRQLPFCVVVSAMRKKLAPRTKDVIFPPHSTLVDGPKFSIMVRHTGEISVAWCTASEPEKGTIECASRTAQTRNVSWEMDIERAGTENFELDEVAEEYPEIFSP